MSGYYLINRPNVRHHFYIEDPSGAVWLMQNSPDAWDRRIPAKADPDEVRIPIDWATDQLGCPDPETGEIPDPRRFMKRSKA